MIDLVGWTATAVFVSSYFFQHPAALRRVQIVGAALWIVYGVLLAAPPVIAANVMLMIVAGWTLHRAKRVKSPPEEPAS